MKKASVIFVSLILTTLLYIPLYAGGQTGTREEAPKTITIVGASMLPAEHLYYRGMEMFAQYLEQNYKGPIDVEVVLHHSGDLGQEKDFFEFMIQGVSVDMAFIAPSWMATWSTAAAFMDTPFLWRDIEHYKKGMDANVFGRVEDELVKKGIRILGYGGGGTRNMILRKPIDSMDDLPSVLMRVMGSPIQANVFNAVGVKATPMAYGEVYNAIKTGVVDGLENEAASMITMKFYEVAPYVIKTKHMITIMPFCFSEKRFQSFPKDLQDAILKAGEMAAKWAQDKEIEEDESMLNELADEGKITLIEFDNSEMIKRAKPVVDDYAKELGVEDLLQEITSIK